ncbi:hypothetical protein [Paracoccus beibuensis]|uniref:hypothetical protein n=1 Tax=Paracoccus beibuensis TaxID=547602 RepID=UPI0022406E91|nr:hypothetical protein [Paracoccus beibuensis]
MKLCSNFGKKGCQDSVSLTAQRRRWNFLEFEVRAHQPTQEPQIAPPCGSGGGFNCGEAATDTTIAPVELKGRILPCAGHFEAQDAALARQGGPGSVRFLRAQQLENLGFLQHLNATKDLPAQGSNARRVTACMLLLAGHLTSPKA